VGKRAIILFEEIREKYQPKQIVKIRLAAAYLERDKLNELVRGLEKFPRQLDILLAYLRYIPVFNDPGLNEKGLDKSIFTKDGKLSGSALQTLLKKGVLLQQEMKVSRFETIPESS